METDGTRHGAHLHTGSLLNFYLTFPLAVQEREEERPAERCPTQAALLHKKKPPGKGGETWGLHPRRAVGEDTRGGAVDVSYNNYAVAHRQPFLH